MYPPIATDDDDYKKPPPPQPAATAPPSGGFSSSDVSTGIPVTSGNRFYKQNPPPAPLIRPRVPWSSGLCDCCLDVRNCCITCWCPCITFGQISEIVDKGSSSCGFNGALYALIGCVTGCCCSCYSCFYRSKMRQQYLLRKTPCNDCLVHCCCEPCALCQEYRELTHRGYDMSIGWHGNVEMRNRGVSMNPVRPAPAPAASAPAVQGSMTR